MQTARRPIGHSLGAERLAGTLGLQATMVPRWGELQLQAEDGDSRMTSVVTAEPTGVHMGRAISAERIIEDIDAGRLAPANAVRRLVRSQRHGSQTTLAPISGTMADGATAIIVIVTICVGLIVPKLVIDRLGQRSRRGPGWAHSLLRAWGLAELASGLQSAHKRRSTPAPESQS